MHIEKASEPQSGPEHTTEEVLVDLLTVGFGNKPAENMLADERVLSEYGTYMIASSLRYSGNRFNRCVMVVEEVREIHDVWECKRTKASSLFG